MVAKDKIIELILNSKNLVFLSGAGVSTLSGIPDYRSIDGIYTKNDSAEYLLSNTCLVREPSKFYEFVKTVYHPKARPNIIHDVIAKLERRQNVTVITQNIDQLHKKAGTSNLLEFHGNLYDLYCLKCHKKIAVEQYLEDYIHAEDGGLIRPNVVLYGEGLDSNIINQSITALSNADTVVVVGTSFKVYPFASLLDYVSSNCKVILINNEDVHNRRIDYKYIGKAQEIFEELEKDIA